MDRSSFDRRSFVAGSAALALFGFVSHTNAVIQTATSMQGIAGGGTIETSNGPAEFSVIGLVLSSPADSTINIVGSLSFLDTVGKTAIESTSVTTLGPVEGSNFTTWQLSGTATLDGAGVHPFALRLTDDGPIGSGRDEFELTLGIDGESEVGDAIYTAKSNVQAGNLQAIVYSLDTAEPASPTPAG